MTKTCARCGEVKSIDDFYANKGSAGGRRGECKVCILAIRQKMYAENDTYRERVLTRAKSVRPVTAPRVCRICEEPMTLGSRAGRPGVCVNCKRALGYKVNVRRDVRLAIYERDGWVCQLCGREVDRTLHPNHTFAATLDHVVPRSLTLFPDDSPANLRLAHRSCNSRRGNRAA